MVGPCRPVVKDGKVVLDDAGNPVARRQSSAWVQVFAVALAQTKNTMKMFSVLASPQLRRDYAVVVGKEQVVGLHGEVTIEAVTSSVTFTAFRLQSSWVRCCGAATTRSSFLNPLTPFTT